MVVKNRTLLRGAALTAWFAPAMALPQPIFSEDFEGLGPYAPGQLGPAALVAEGWIFRVQSGNPSPPYGWRHLSYFPQSCGVATFLPQGGSGYLISDGESSWTVGGNPTHAENSNWAILPAIPGQAAGHVMTFWARRGTEITQEWFEIRYSATGGTSTGAGPSGVGDFAQLLLTASPLSGSTWTFFSAPIPGNGRLAIRYYSPNAASACVQHAAIDTLSIGPPTGPCSAYPVIPTAGQTVTWTAAGGPWHICTHTIIPAGATVIIESGAEVFVDPGSDLEVHGDLQVQAGARVDTRLDINDPNAAQGSVFVYGTAELLGVPGNPVRLTGNPRGRGTLFTKERFGAMPGGKITASYVDLTTTLSAIGTGVVIADHVNVSGHLGFNSNGFYTGQSDDISQVPGGTIALRDSTFGPQTEFYAQEGYILLENISFDNAVYEHQRVFAAQPMYLNTLTARNNADTPFVLRGWDFYFGPDNIIENNGYPVRAEYAGIAPGSTLPATGNTTNRVDLLYGRSLGEVTWSNIAIPYEIKGDPSGLSQDFSQIEVQPGVTVKMGPLANIANNGATLRMLGRPDQPITFERLDPAQPWFSIWKTGGIFDLCKFEYVHLSGGTRGVDADGSDIFVDSCLFENNEIGGMARNGGTIVAHKSRFFGNGAGLFTTPGGTAGIGLIRADAEGAPNWFEGNSAGLESQHFGVNDLARDNYWGSSTGPNDEDNPGGAGDATPGPNLVIPYLSAPPNMADTPPIVRLRNHTRLFEEGDKIILHWTASDDSSIDHFEIWITPHMGSFPDILVAANIPGAARSWEMTIPPAVLASNFGDPNRLRVVAYDDAGQKGFDALLFDTPSLPGITVTGGVFPPGRTLRPGEQVEMCHNVQVSCDGGCGGFTSTAYLELHGDLEIPMTAGPYVGGCAFSVRPVPPVSTDLARNVFEAIGAGGRYVYEFSEFYSIRPDPAIGDAPPQIALTSPQGAAYAGAGMVPIAWTASDDEALRSFDIHASYNNGRTWSTIVDGLPAGARSYSWQLPPSTGISQAKVRVLARDLRFQVSSSTSTTFEITPGSGSVPGDVNSDGHVDLVDLALLLSSFGLCQGDAGFNAAADFDQSGCVELGDLALLLANFGA